MTSEVATSAGTDVAVGATGELGLGMAYRARSQSVLGQHWSPAGLIGAVGRASVGFGLAVGRSRAIRPTVRLDDLNSAALRPALDLWRMRRDEVADVAETMPSETPERRAAPPDGRNRTPRRLSGRNDLRRSVRRATGRPSWTDQIIQRSSVGYVAPAPGGPMPEPATPAGFVPTGDAKLDRLRLLVAERDGGTVRASREVPISPPLEPRDAGIRSGSEPAAAEATPGTLARSMRPEPAVPPPGRTGGSVLPGGVGLSTPRTGNPAQRSHPMSGVARSGMPDGPRPGRRATRGLAPDKLDLLRAALVERGLLNADDSGADPSAGVPDVAPLAEPSDETGRTEARLRRTPVPSPGEVGSGRVTNTSADLRRAVEGGRPSRPGTAPSTPTVDPAGGAEQGRMSSTWDPDAPRSTTDARDVRLRRLLRTGLGRSDVEGRLEQRHGRDASDVEGPADGVVGVSVGSVDPTLPRTSSAVTTTSSIAPAAVATSESLPSVPGAVAVSAVRAAGRTEGSAERGRIPVLLSRGVTDPGTVIRRVTLPRALSTRHRPASSLAASNAPRALMQPNVGRPTSQVGDTVISRAVDTSRPSMVAIGAMPEAWATGPLAADAARTADRPAALVADRSSPAAAVTDPSPVASQWGRRTTSIVPAGTGALLDVIRRTTRPAPPRLVVAGDVLGEGRTVTSPNSAPAPADLGRDLAPEDRSTVRRRQGASPGSVDRSAEHPPGGVLPAAGAVSVHGSPAESVAEQFMTTLSETIRRRPAPLPTTFRPMADAIAGPRPVMLSTDTASRRALRSVGKVAATTGDTIHLDERAVPTSRLAEVMAHELTHVAHPSPTPRFFDDIDDSPEERRAEHVAKLMARSPLAPSATTSAPTIRRSAGSQKIRRAVGASSRSSAGASSGADTVSADALAASLTRDGSSRSAVRRLETPTSSGPPVTASPVSGGEASSESSTSEGWSEDVFDTSRAAEWFRQQLAGSMPRVIRDLEDRMIVELDRRGGRTWRNT